MNEVVFSICFCVIMVCILLTLIDQFRCIRTVKAGKVTDFSWGRSIFWGKMPQCLQYKNTTIDASNMKIMRVVGNSMQYYDIVDNDVIAITPYSTYEEQNSIIGHPVLVLKITPSNDKRTWWKGLYDKLDSDYKLRKFISYVPNVHAIDIDAMFNTLNKPKISLTDFKEQCSRKINRIPADTQDLYILSETFDCSKRKIDYSFHRVADIYAKAEYVLEK